MGVRVLRGVLDLLAFHPTQVNPVNVVSSRYKRMYDIDLVPFSRTVKILAFKVYFHTIHRFPDDAKLAMHNLNWMVYLPKKFFVRLI